MNSQNFTWKQRQIQARKDEIRTRIAETIVGLGVLITWLAVFILVV